MNFKKLEQATRLYAKVKVLDSEIIEIDRFALIVANGDIKATLELTIMDPEDEWEREKRGLNDAFISSFNEAVGYILRRNERGELVREPLHPETIPYPKNQVLNRDISESTTLSILGVLLYEKQTQRAELIKKIEALGVIAK